MAVLLLLAGVLFPPRKSQNFFVPILTAGYLKDPEDSHRLVVDGHAAPIVLRMYEMAAQGDRVSAIVKYLNDTGVVPPRRYFGQIGLVSSKEADCHIHWNKGIVYSILHNRVYCGDMVQGKSATMNHVQKKRPESEWVVTENTHEAIVSRALWGQVQQIWEKYKSGESVPYNENIFLRKIFCGHCGFTLRRTRNNKKTYCFKCETRFTYDKDDCVPVSINEDELKEQLLAMLRKKLLVFADNQSRIPAQTKMDTDAELREVRAALGKTRGFLKGLYEHLMQGYITADEYKAMKSNYESDIASMSALEQKLREDAISRAVREAEYSKAAGSLVGVQASADLTAEIIDAFVERIDIFENKRIKVTWRFMVETGAGGEVGCGA